MGKVLSIRVTDRQVERLGRMARQMRMKPSQAAAALLEEALRMDEYPGIEFRDTVVGREAYLQGHRIKLWQVEWIARNYNHDPKKTAEHFNLQVWEIEDAFKYGEAFRDEMEEAIADNSKSFEDLQKIVPNIRLAW